MKRYIAIALTAIMLLTSLTSCFKLGGFGLDGILDLFDPTEDTVKNENSDNNKTDESENDTQNDEAESVTDTDTETETETESESESDTEKAKDTIVIAEKNKKTNYQIIYADNADSSTISYAGNIAYALESFYKVTIYPSPEFADWGNPSTTTEILLGNITSRPETAEAKKLLKGVRNEYIIKMFDNGRLVIAASNTDSLKEAVTYFQNAFIVDNTGDVVEIEKGFEYYADLGNTTGAKWQLSGVPEYTSGILAKGIYRLGCGLICDSSNKGNMHTISDTTATEFDDYITTLTSSGFVITADNKYNGNRYVQLKKDRKLMYTFFLAALGEVRVLDDTASVTEEEFEYTYTPKATDTSGFYQFALMYDPRAGGASQFSGGRLYPNCGALHILRLADNSVVLIDGGYEGQASPTATAALLEFLYQITGVDPNSNEKIRVAAWYMTHPHTDHMYLARNLFRDYSDKVELERVMHNLPSGSVGIEGNPPQVLLEMSRIIAKNYPKVKFVKLHMGQKIQLANLTIDVLLTHEVMTNPETGYTIISEDGNSASTIMKFTFHDGAAITYFGDWGGAWQVGGDPVKLENYYLQEERFLSIYEIEDGTYPMLKADAVQVAHHAMNDWLDNVYDAVDADYVFIAQADVEESMYIGPCYSELINEFRNRGVADSNLYFASRKTHWLIFDNGTITHGEQKLTGADEAGYVVDSNGEFVLDESGNQIWAEGYWTILEPYKPFYNE